MNEGLPKGEIRLRTLGDMLKPRQPRIGLTQGGSGRARNRGARVAARDADMQKKIRRPSYGRNEVAPYFQEALPEDGVS